VTNERADCPGGTSGDSPRFQPWVADPTHQAPQGRKKIPREISAFFRPCGTPSGSGRNPAMNMNRCAVFYLPSSHLETSPKYACTLLPKPMVAQKLGLNLGVLQRRSFRA
jgi:hypothetical protein